MYNRDVESPGLTDLTGSSAPSCSFRAAFVQPPDTFDLDLSPLDSIRQMHHVVAI